MAAPNTILLAGQMFIPQEKNAAEAIIPGHLVSFNSSGLLIKHNTAGGAAAPWFARENVTPDRGATTLPIDTPYATGETVYWFDGRDCEVLALVPASAPAILTGDPLSSNGDGTLRKTSGADVIIARAAENVNNSAGTAVARLRIYAGS
jgi:hypothetical protein